MVLGTATTPQGAARSTALERPAEVYSSDIRTAWTSSSLIMGALDHRSPVSLSFVAGRAPLD